MSSSLPDNVATASLKSDQPSLCLGRKITSPANGRETTAKGNLPFGLMGCGSPRLERLHTASPLFRPHRLHISNVKGSRRSGRAWQLCTNCYVGKFKASGKKKTTTKRLRSWASFSSCITNFLIHPVLKNKYLRLASGICSHSICICLCSTLQALNCPLTFLGLQ